MMVHIMEAKVAQEVTNRSSPPFGDPTEKGLDKMFNTSWIEDTLSKTTSADDDLETGEQDIEVNLDYELADNL